jgi:hypothetical protein
LKKLPIPILSEEVKKPQNFMLISNALKVFKKFTKKKVISKTSLMNMSKSGKSAYFHHDFANNFFCTFLKTFTGFEISMKFCGFFYLFWKNWYLKSAWNSAFFDTFFIFFLLFLGQISAFFKLWSQPTKNGKPFFINMS